MPELPEVEIVKQSLEKKVKFKIIDNIIINNRNLRYKIQKNFKKSIKNKKILDIYRRSKYIILKFENNVFLIIHLGMSGTLHYLKKKSKNLHSNLSFYQSETLPKKHNHIEIFFSNFKIVYNDPRRFGFFRILNSKNELINYFKNKGPEPYDKLFSLKYFKNKIYKKNKNIKNFLLDQNFVSGIGNIYASEILFYSKINPLKKAGEITNIEIKKIIKYSKYVLNRAIKKGGSSIKNFKSIQGNLGSYQNEFKVYGKDGKICPSKNCNEKIVKLNISKRSTYVCYNCQN
tara:strand:+ start:1757 stop:2620 length:864 start_codon:yes stop_codon:yes gene_type:complete